jgi:hypothetical protein
LVVAGDAAVRYWEAARPWIIGGIVALVVVRVAIGVRKRRKAASSEGSTRN